MRLKRRLAILCIGLSIVAGACATREKGIESSRDISEGAGTRADLAKCPVMENEPIDPAIYTKTSEGPVYFCCKDCIAKYKANPAKYADKVAAQRRALSDR